MPLPISLWMFFISCGSSMNGFPAAYPAYSASNALLVSCSSPRAAAPNSWTKDASRRKVLTLLRSLGATYTFPSRFAADLRKSAVRAFSTLILFKYCSGFSTFAAARTFWKIGLILSVRIFSIFALPSSLTARSLTLPRR